MQPLFVRLNNESFFDHFSLIHLIAEVSSEIQIEKTVMASRKRPHDSTKPETPTNGLNSSLQDIDIHNGSNSSFDDGHHTNGDSSTTSDQYSIKHAPNRPVSFCLKL